MFSYLCSTCGETHEGAPSFSYNSPYYYDVLREKERLRIGKLDNDFCSIGEEDFFIRACLEIPIIDSEEGFLWGVWVSQSRDNFMQYYNNYNSDTYSQQTFGYLSNRLAYYPDTLLLKTQVSFQPNGQRPTLKLEETDHPISIDFHRGISKEKASDIAQMLVH